MENNLKNFPVHHKEDYGVVKEPNALTFSYENEAQALEIRAQEIDFEKQEEEHSFQFSKYTIETQLLNQKAQLSHSVAMQRNAYLFMTVTFTGIVSLIGTALVLNKDSIAVEMIKMIVYIFAGGVGGYGLKNTNNTKDDKVKENENKI
jgi:hypothetical protein